MHETKAQPTPPLPQTINPTQLPMPNNAAAADQPLPAPNPLSEVFRDPWLLAVHKPAGLLVHRSPIDRHETEFALQYARNMNGGEYVYPLHRLDRPTSGLLVFARDPQTASILVKSLMAGEVRKTYLAMVRGWPPEQGLIDHPLRDEPEDRRLKGQPQPLRDAVTRYRRLATTEIPVAIKATQPVVTAWSSCIRKPDANTNCAGT